MDMEKDEEVAKKKRNSPRTYILSFDESTMVATARTTSTEAKKAKKRSSSRNASLTQIDHMMAERKRRQLLAHKLIALSATIPGLKKTDKISIIEEAVNHMKQLEERVRKLEQQNSREKESIIFLKKTDLSAENEDGSTSTCEQDCSRHIEMLPDVEARVMGNQLLIEIHCVKHDGVELTVLNLLENIHLSVIASNVLPFGNSTLGITIIAQMGDTYRMTVNDLVKRLRQELLNHMTMNVSK
ncbi:hypothetical protein RJT34_25944 [Clitoria ternatea]|uniref:BHLH domain-containing protein n=1 Tax=Clitoria ternatea TaxID=43366 RepID=A0AAN9I7Q6_CLITE